MYAQTLLNVPLKAWGVSVWIERSLRSRELCSLPWNAFEEITGIAVPVKMRFALLGMYAKEWLSNTKEDDCCLDKSKNIKLSSPAKLFDCTRSNLLSRRMIWVRFFMSLNIGTDPFSLLCATFRISRLEELENAPFIPPSNRFRSAWNSTRFDMLRMDSTGRSPVKSFRSNRITCSLLGSEGGIVPFNLLSETLSSTRSLHEPIDRGMVPVSRLWRRSRYSRFLSCPSSVGIVPVFETSMVGV